MQDLSSDRLSERASNAATVAASPNPFAYLFYATNDTYAVAAMVAIAFLKQLKPRDDIDFVVLHLRIAGHILATMQRMGVFARQVGNLPPAYPPHFKDSLIKLRVFEQLQYRRVVFLDADTIPLASLDHLFDLEFGEAVAAPRAYWLGQPFATSLLLVVKPSLSMWARVERHFDTACVRRLADMDIINLEFLNDTYYLPDEYSCLNSEWEDRDAPHHFGVASGSHGRIKLLHFTALGKPWSYRPATVRQLRPNADPEFYEHWESWWRVRDQVIAGAPFVSRLRYLCLKFRCLLEAQVRRGLRSRFRF
jgi:alpha-N-acetylglucosamine transferase